MEEEIQIHEIWKPIVGYKGRFEISNFGRVKSMERMVERREGRFGKRMEMIMKEPKADKWGYIRIGLSNGHNAKKTLPVHRLVAMAFLKNRYNKPCVNHIDGDKSNNKVSNLEWVTHSENSKHAYDIGIRKASISGESNPRARFTKDIIREIRNHYANGASIPDLKNKYNEPYKEIWRIVKNKTWIGV